MPIDQIGKKIQLRAIFHYLPSMSAAGWHTEVTTYVPDIAVDYFSMHAHS